MANICVNIQTLATVQTSFTFPIYMRQTGEGKENKKSTEHNTVRQREGSRIHTGGGAGGEVEGQELQLQSNPSWDHYDEC